jgi:hypothetical protein
MTAQSRCAARLAESEVNHRKHPIASSLESLKP